MAVAAFLLIAAVALGSALGLVLKRNPIHGALFLVVNLGSIAGLYLMMGYEFLAFAQVIVYAGAIMVLFLFAIFVLIPGKEETGTDPRRRWRLLSLPVVLALWCIMVFVLARLGRAGTGGPRPPGLAAGLATLFTDFLLPFEVTSVLLLAAMVGVLLLARRRA